MGSTTGETSYNTIGGIKNLQVLLKNRYSNKTIDITPQIIDITIYEDIFLPTIYGTLVLLDAIDLLNGVPSGTQGDFQFPIIGEETLQISFQQAGRNDFKLNFDTYKIENIDIDQKYRSRTFAISFVSKEQTIDAGLLVQQGFNQPVSNTVTSIFNSQLVNSSLAKSSNLEIKTLTTQPTKGAQQLIIPRLSPLEAMRFLSKRAIDANGNLSASYLFFENKAGYNFCDVEYLISQGIKRRTADQTVQQSNNNNSLDGLTSYYDYLYGLSLNEAETQFSANQFKHILNMSRPHNFDTIEKLKMGLFESDVDVYDYINLQVNNYHFSANTLAKFTSLGSNLENSNNFIKQFNTNYTKKFFIPKDTSLPDTFLDQIVANRTSFFTRMIQNLFLMETYGDTQINAGDVINVNLPTIVTGTSGATVPDKYLAGNFLITGIKHKINFQSYYTDFTVYKIGLETAIS